VNWNIKISRKQNLPQNQPEHELWGFEGDLATSSWKLWAEVRISEISVVRWEHRTRSEASRPASCRGFCCVLQGVPGPSKASVWINEANNHRLQTACLSAAVLSLTFTLPRRLRLQLLKAPLSSRNHYSKRLHTECLCSKHTPPSERRSGTSVCVEQDADFTPSCHTYKSNKGKASANV